MSDLQGDEEQGDQNLGVAMCRLFRIRCMHLFFCWHRFIILRNIATVSCRRHRTYLLRPVNASTSPVNTHPTLPITPKAPPPHRSLPIPPTSKPHPKKAHTKTQDNVLPHNIPLHALPAPTLHEPGDLLAQQSQSRRQPVRLRNRRARFCRRALDRSVSGLFGGVGEES